MKVAFIFFHFLPNIGGAEISMLIYARKLCKRGHKIVIITTKSYKFKLADLSSLEILNECITVRRLYFIPFPFKYAFITPELSKVITEINPDVIVVFSVLPSFFIIASCLIAKIRKIPLILHPQFNPLRYLTYRTFLSRILGKFFDEKVVPILIKLANFIVSITDEEETYYRLKIGMNNVATIYDPVLPLKPNNQNVKYILSKYDLNKRKVILAVGRIIPYKGFQFVIGALSYIITHYRVKNVKLIVVGEDWGYLSDLLQLVKKLKLEKFIIFTGRVSNSVLHALYEISDVVVVPSLFEAYGRVVIEAWLHKKPVVVSPFVGLSELVDKVKGGITVKPTKIKDLAQAILKAMNSPEMGKNGYKFVINNMLPEVASEKLERILIEVVLKNRTLV